MIEYRRLTHDDYEDIVGISKDIWEGNDYLPQVFHKWVDDKGFFSWSCRCRKEEGYSCWKVQRFKQTGIESWAEWKPDYLYFVWQGVD